MKRLLLLLLIPIALNLVVCVVGAERKVEIESRLEIPTFWSDFAFIEWYLTVNLTEPNLDMKMLIPGDVVTMDLNTSFELSSIAKELDSSENHTRFYIETPLPIGVLSGDFPDDEYAANYFIGCNFITQNASIDLGGNIPGPTDNYQVSWTLSSDPNFSEVVSQLPSPALTDLNNITHWLRLRLHIFHRPQFHEYLGILMKQVPSSLEVFGWIVALLVYGRICYDSISNRSIISKSIILVEHLVLPISIAVIVFIPVYILALQPFEAPLTIPIVGRRLVDVLYLYIVILAIGVVLRVASSDKVFQGKIESQDETEEQKNGEFAKTSGRKSKRMRVLSIALALWIISPLLFGMSNLLHFLSNPNESRLLAQVVAAISLWTAIVTQFFIIAETKELKTMASDQEVQNWKKDSNSGMFKLQYEQLNAEIRGRDNLTIIAGSIMVTASLLLLGILLELRGKINLDSGVLLIFASLGIYSIWLLCFNLTSRYLNRLEWDRLHAMEEARDFKLHGLIYDQVKTKKWWKYGRRFVWLYFFYILSIASLLALLV
jgi:hypothetical protein